AAPGETAGRQPAWWRGAVSWLAERLPFVGWSTAASEDGVPAPPEDDGSTPTVDLLDPLGDQNQSGNEGEGDDETKNDWDPDG
ncbi:MAG TPA: hypothetical protein VHM02_12825, partial [Thermoanaerobaculia bacterium]|nr:hypothetical protein [Thermoanaerobaculia bacterium]